MDNARVPRVLFVGESWVKHTIHQKGVDSFVTTNYEEGAEAFLAALDDGGFQVDYVRAHEISQRFPESLEGFRSYDVVVISDVGANSFLLTDATFARSEVTANRLSVLSEFVQRGGGLVMVGGYMSFSGIDGRARFQMSPLAEVLPVEMLHYDDRIEMPQGMAPEVVLPEHAIVSGLPDAWPLLLGYNRTVSKPQSSVVVRCGEDPLLVIGRAGAGRSVAFTSDLAPHWAPPDFVQWTYYGDLWRSIVQWAAGIKGVMLDGGVPQREGV